MVNQVLLSVISFYSNLLVWPGCDGGLSGGGGSGGIDAVGCSVSCCGGIC